MSNGERKRGEEVTCSSIKTVRDDRHSTCVQCATDARVKENPDGRMCRYRMSGMLVRNLLAVSLLTAGAFPSVAAADDGPRETPLVRAVQQSRKSVVNIHTEKTAAEDRDSRLFATRPRKVTGMGTGIVVDERGYIVTNFHVIQEVDLITVTLDDGSAFDATVISFDRRQDLAIIRVESKQPLTVMPMGTSSDLMLAETVYAVGNAFGYEHTVTSGIVSALHRDVEVDEVQSYENLIQTDASINPGNSGGPLLNLNGEVIGINVAIRSGAQRIGFAIPIDDARRTIARLLSVEKLNGLSHGLQTVDVKSHTERKLVVESVHAGSAAEECGISAGDIICNVRGIAVADGTDLERALLDQPKGQMVEVRLQRDGKEHVRQFTIGAGKNTAPQTASTSVEVMRAAESTRTVALPAMSVSQTKSPEDPALIRTWEILGIRLQPLSSAEQQELTQKAYPGARGPVKYNGGMKVVEIRSESVASTLLQEGDILLGLDGFETVSTSNLGFILGEARITSTSRMKCQYFRQGTNPLEGTLNLARP